MATEWIGFDLDGVIIRNPFELGVEPFVCRYIAARSPDRPDIVPERTEARIAADIAREFQRRMGQNALLAYDWDGVYRDVAVAWSVPSVPDVAELVTRFARDPAMVAILPGGAAALAAARDAGYKVAALTNGFSRFQIPTLEALGLMPAFDDIITPEETGSCKPATHFFQQRPGLVAHVGDTLWHDVRGARLAGLDALWVHARAPEQATTSIDEIEPAVRTVAAGDALRQHYPEVDVACLMPHVAARRPDRVVARWLDTEHPKSSDSVL